MTERASAGLGIDEPAAGPEARPDTEALLDALDRLRGTGSEHDGFLANHGPMAAEAMLRLGAAEHVPGWVDQYRRRLSDEPPPGDVVTAANWRDHLGDIRRLGDWNRFFDLAVREADWRSVLVMWWPRLLPGAAASATHGLIRTCHAVRALSRAGDPDRRLAGELGRGLALWAARYQPLPGHPTLTGPLGSVGAIAALPRLAPTVPSAGPGVSGRLRTLGRLPELPDALDGWGPAATGSRGAGGAATGAAALDELVSAAARVLAAREDAPIALCHTVTAPAAIQLVLPLLPSELHRPSIAAGWQVSGALVAAYASPRLAAEAEVQAEAADLDPADVVAELAPRAVEHGDEHVIKLTEAALRQFARTGDHTLLLAATRFRGRIPILSKHP